MNKTLIRSLSGLVFISLIAGSLLWGAIPFTAVLLFFCLIACIEFLIISRKSGLFPCLLFSIFSFVLLFLAITLPVLIPVLSPDIFYCFLSASLFISFVMLLFIGKGKLLNNTAASIFPLLYIVLPFATLTLIYNIGNGFEHAGRNILIGFFFILWMYDSMAYVSGVLWGKFKVAPKISPGKSWEGIAGGAFFAMVSVLSLHWLLPILNFWQWVILALIIIIFSTLGDLFESRLKRDAGLKDSGNIMPGHGGMLDRFDGVLFAAPAVYLYLLLIF